MVSANTVIHFIHLAISLHVFLGYASYLHVFLSYASCINTLVRKSQIY